MTFLYHITCLTKFNGLLSWHFLVSYVLFIIEFKILVKKCSNSGINKVFNLKTYLKMIGVNNLFILYIYIFYYKFNKLIIKFVESTN
jgi:hypothetical protein